MSKKDEKKPMGRKPMYGPRQNVTMQWPIDLVPVVDAAADTAGLSRTEFTIQALREKMESKQHGE